MGAIAAGGCGENQYIYPGNYKGMAAIYVENKILQAVVLPELGAKIASLRYLPQDFEVFFQPAKGLYQMPCYGDAFSRYDTSGADEMFPAIDGGEYPYGPYRKQLVPDHGEVWSLPWAVQAVTENLVTQVRGRSFPYCLTRQLALSGSVVRLDYTLRNEGEDDFYGLWAFHGLVNCDWKSRIQLPGVAQVVNVHDSDNLGEAGTPHAFPLTNDCQGTAVNLDRVGPKEKNNTEKFYVHPNAPMEGEASILLNQGRLKYRLLFPKEKVSYLGVWINEGGFKGEYNCALEPSTGYYDSVEIACKNGKIMMVPPGGEVQWHLEIELTDVLVPYP